MNRRVLEVAASAVVAAGAAGCAYEVDYDPAYVPSAAPQYVADGKLLIIVPPEQQELVYEGRPDSATGNFTTLTVPLGAIMRDISEQVFSSCFARGVEFAPERAAGGDYVIALESTMEDFVYRYTSVIDQGFGDDVDTWIVPEVDIALGVRAFDRAGATVLSKTYDSGVRAGESYRVTNRPEERINATLHATLHDLMLQVAADLRPLLIGECSIVDID